MPVDREKKKWHHANLLHLINICLSWLLSEYAKECSDYTSVCFCGCLCWRKLTRGLRLTCFTKESCDSILPCSPCINGTITIIAWPHLHLHDSASPYPSCSFEWSFPWCSTALLSWPITLPNWGGSEGAIFYASQKIHLESTTPSQDMHCTAQFLPGEPTPEVHVKDPHLIQNQLISDR